MRSRMLVTRKGVTKGQELRAAKSPRKVFRGDGISNRTPEDQAGFPGRDGARPWVQRKWAFTDPETRNLGPWG